MIIWDKKNGYVYEDETNGKRYSLFEAKCYQGEGTSDIVIMWDEEKNCFANYVYGATTQFENIAELDENVRYYVDEYEAKQKRSHKADASIVYNFTKAGLEAFEDRACADFFAEMEKEWEEQNLAQFDIVVSCGKHKIRIPLGAEEWNATVAMIKECLEVNEC